MKLKFINLLLAAFLLIGSAQALTSCKDTDEDLYAQLRDDNLKIENKIKLLQELHEKDIVALRGVTDGLQTQIENLKTLLNNYATKDDLNNYVTKAEFNKHLENYRELNALYESLKSQLDKMEKAQAEINKNMSDRVDGLQKTIEENYATLNGQLAELYKLLEGYAPVLKDIETLKQFMEETNESLAQIGIDIKQNTESITKIENSVTVLNEFMTTWNSERLTAIEKDAADALAKATANESAVAGINETIDLLKETIEALKKEVSDNKTATDEQIAALQTKIDEQVAALQAKIDELEGKLQTILDDYMKGEDVDAKIAEALANYATKDDILDMVTKGQLDITLAGYTTKEELEAALENCTTKEELEAALKGLLTEDALKGYATEEYVQALVTALRLEAQANLDAVELRLQQQINFCITRLNGLDTKVADIETVLNALQGEVTGVKGDLAEVVSDLSDLTFTVGQNSTAISQAQESINSILDEINGEGKIKDQLSDLSGLINANKEAIETINKTLDSILVRVFNLEQRVSSIIIQGTANPVLGYLKTPFGIESTMLMNYMGENTKDDISFPNFLIEGSDYGSDFFSDDDINFLTDNGEKTIEGKLDIAAGQTLFSDAEGNLGKVYLTVNPSNADVTGKDFTVVNSQNKVLPIELKNLRPSNAELTFGYSRAQAEAISANGFYEADATVAAGDVPALRVVVDNELKATTKKVLSDLKNNHTASASSLMALANAVYNQFNGFLPALGIRAAWQEKDIETGNNVDVYTHSQYNLAAATFKPLPYSFLYDKSFSPIHLPDISGFLDKYKFDFSDTKIDIKFPEFAIKNLKPIHFSINITNPIGSLGKITFIIDGYPVSVNPDGSFNTTNKEITIDLDKESDIADQINSALNAAFGSLNEDLDKELESFVKDLVTEIERQVNEMLVNMKKEVNTNLTTVLTDLQKQVNGKIDMISNQITNNALYSKLQAIINKINGILDNPNHYLQPVLLYSAQGQSFGMFSQVKKFPTQFVGNGNAVMLTPTTYTGEIVTPAYLKYVAVTNVYKSSDYSVNISNDDDCKKLADKANAQPYVNEVVSGERRTIPFFFEGGKGYTYEIVYQAMDYAGTTSTSKYYVSIK